MRSESTLSRYRILHLGMGAFHRAHQAAYLQDLQEQGDTGWEIVAGNIRPGDENTISALQRQQGRYTLETVAPDGDRSYRNIESINQVIAFQTDHADLKAMAADPATRIISFTVTEAGYYLKADDQLDLDIRVLKDDLESGNCNTLYGSLATLLETRRLAGSGPVTLMSCDNLQGNGHRFRNAFLEFLSLRKQNALLDWVIANTSSPNSMVDRITPRPDEAVASRLSAVSGTLPLAGICSEAFRQWVIEDDFIAGRPGWERVGAELVDDVEPYEDAKLRILNASHSVVAWAGLLKGYKTVHESINDPAISNLVNAFVSEEVIPSLGQHPMDLNRYRDDVVARFGNPFIVDTNERILTDSLAKISTFILPTIRSRLALNESIEKSACALANFLLVMEDLKAGRLDITYADQSLDAELRGRLMRTADICREFSNVSFIFKELAGDKRLEDAIAASYHTQLKAGRNLGKMLPYGY